MADRKRNKKKDEAKQDARRDNRMLAALVHRNCAGDVRIAKDYLEGDAERLVLSIEDTPDEDGYVLRTYLTPPKAEEPEEAEAEAEADDDGAEA